MRRPLAPLVRPVRYPRCSPTVLYHSGSGSRYMVSVMSVAGAHWQLGTLPQPLQSLAPLELRIARTHASVRFSLKTTELDVCSALCEAAGSPRVTALFGSKAGSGLNELAAVTLPEPVRHGPRPSND